MRGRRRGDWGRNGNAGSETTVLILELLDSALEIRELGFPPVSAVLGSDTVAVCAGLLALFRGEVGACALTGWLLVGGGGLCEANVSGARRVR